VARRSHDEKWNGPVAPAHNSKSPPHSAVEQERARKPVMTRRDCLCVAIDAVTRLAAEVAGRYQLAQQRTGPVLRVTQILLKHFQY
jgi:hypothetical protein